MKTTHLHLHTRYSLQIGYGKSEDFAALAGAGSALAITDTFSMAGILEHDRACAKHGVKPIFGIEARVAGAHRIVLLAENNHGLENLYALAGLYGNELGYNKLAELSSGVIALTGHIGGAIPTAILRGDKTALSYHLKRLIEIFGKDRLFLEKVDWGLREQHHINLKLDEISALVGLRTVLTNDVHYPTQEDALGQALLVCDKLGKSADLSELLCHRVTDAWLTQIDDPVAQEIADRCSATITRHKPLLPRFSDDDNKTLYDMTRQGLDKRGKGGEAAYQQRQQFEFEVITKMGFAGYYLIVADVVEWARAQDIPLGMGRGSGPGSIAAWTTWITQIDPVRHKLYFERFLNPERVSMPDFDVDVGVDRRGEILTYLKGRYGEETVTQISSWGKYQPKLAWQSAGRVLGLSRSETLGVSKRHMSRLEENATMGELLEAGAFDKLIKEHPRYEGVLQAAGKMERGMRTHGKHAGGIVLLDRPVWKVMPLSPGGMTAFDHHRVEEIGGVKFDFLGVRELDALYWANASVDFCVDLNNLDENDPGVWDLIKSGHHVGMFQIEGGGMSSYIVVLRPDNIPELAVGIALFRPGPMDTLPRGQHEIFADRKHGRLPVEYLHEDQKEVLDETYGVIVYQEQIMFLVQLICGMSMGGADILRRAIGKKDSKLLAKQREAYMEGARAKGYEEGFLARQWDQIETFARYGFNRAHAVAYAYLCYQTAYMKHHYPAEFIGAQARVRGSDLKEVDKFVTEALRLGLQVVPPNVSRSPVLFFGKGDRIHWGIAALGGIGQDYAQGLVDLAPWENMRDFIYRSGCSSDQFSSLLYAGALDGLLVGCPGLQRVELDVHGNLPPDQCYVLYPMAVARFKRWSSDRKTNASQGYAVPFEGDDLYRFDIPFMTRITGATHAAFWTARHAALGTWGVYHPCNDTTDARKLLGTVWVSELAEFIGERVRVLVMVTDVEYREYKSRDGDIKEMARYTLSDQTGRIEVVQFDGLEKCRPWGGLMLLTMYIKEGRNDGDTHSAQVVSMARIDAFHPDGPQILQEEEVKPRVPAPKKEKTTKTHYNPDQMRLI